MANSKTDVDPVPVSMLVCKYDSRGNQILFKYPYCHGTPETQVTEVPRLLQDFYDSGEFHCSGVILDALFNSIC